MNLGSIAVMKTMPMSRIKGSCAFFAPSLLVMVSLVGGPSAGFAQTYDLSGEQAQKAEPSSDTLRPSDQALESQQSHAQEALSQAGCSLRGFFHETWTETSQFGQGLKAVPRGTIRPSNLKWELPILAATGVLIAKVDRPADNRIQSKSLQQTAGQWSNVGLGLEIGSAALAYGAGCGKHHSYLRDSGFKALAAMGAAGTVDLALKLTFDRQFPYTPGSTGRFWGGGRSFPSGHSATSFAFAAVIAHRYPNKRWLKWSAYALATGVALSRYPAKKHYPSDILMGATIGYVSGAYLAEH
jgi:PAP2 superfamily